MLRGRGFDCLTTYQVGLGAASDNDLAVYADDKGLVLVSHDKPFFRRRQKGTQFGQHVDIKVREMDAAGVLDNHLDEVVDTLQRISPVLVQVRRESVQVHWPERERPLVKVRTVKPQELSSGD